MEPGCAVEDLLPVEQINRRFGDAGIRAVIHDLGRTLIGAGLKEIDAHAAIHHLDAGHIHAKAAHIAQAGLADGVVGQGGHKCGVQP